MTEIRVKESNLPSDKEKDDSQDSSDISKVRDEGMFKQNPVILLSLWFSITRVSYYRIKKKLTCFVSVNLGLDCRFLSDSYTVNIIA